MKTKQILSRYGVVVLLAWLSSCASAPPTSPQSYGLATRPFSDPVVIDSFIVSDFDGFNYGNVYEFANGQFWEQTEPWIWIWIAVQPRAVIFTYGSLYKMKVEQIDHAILVRQIEPVVQSRVVSDFSGLDQGNLYELSNGQIWEQTEAKIRVRIRVSPRAVIWKSEETYKMKIGDIAETVTVRRVK